MMRACGAKPQAEERNTTAALVRGVASSLAQMGVAVAGFDLRATSSLVAGGGMSSSAAFEMLCACVINLLFADGRVMPLDLARASLAAEREWYGKPCGLQDQAAIASGGISVLDFASPLNPVIRHLDFDFGASGYCVCLIDVGCDHSEHAEQFAAIPHDMFEAARFLGAEVLGGVGEAEYLARLPQLRGVLGDRIALRGLHFYREQRLVKRRVEALERGDIHAYLRDTLASSRSSAEYLQNVSDGGEEQPAMVVLALCDMLLDGRGAFRIHGGGFGGTVQAYVPLDMLGDFRTGIESQLGRDSCHVLTLGKEAAFAESI